MVGGNWVGVVGSEHTPHAKGQLPFMYEGLFSHSPNLAHTGHRSSWSAHNVVVGCVVAGVVVAVVVVVMGCVVVVVGGSVVLGPVVVEETVEVDADVVGVTPSVSAISTKHATTNH